MKLSVIIPAYNEQTVLKQTLLEVKGYLQKNYPGQSEIIVVDDGSTDSTASIAEQDKDVKLIRLGSNQGKGAAVKKGVLAAGGEKILFMDADNSTSIDELQKWRADWDAFDILIASRALPSSIITVKQPFIKVFFGKLGNLLIQTLLLPGIKDSRCGFKLYPAAIKPLFEQLQFKGFSFDDEILFLASKAGLKIKEEPVRWVNNFDSKVRGSDYITTLFDIFRVRLTYIMGGYKIADKVNNS